MNNQFEHMQKLAFGKIITEVKKGTLTEGTLKDKIRELVMNSLDEAKKKKKEPEDVAPQEDVDINVDAEEAPMDTVTPEVSAEVDVDPKVKAIQDALNKALANAKALNDEKLVNQIGNTITMLVRTQVVGQQAVAEDKLPSIIKRNYPNEQNPVVKKYLEDLRNYESTHTDDLDDWKNLATAIDLYYKELINKINNIDKNLNEISSETIDRMEGLASIRDLKRLQDLLRIVSMEWLNEGFEKDDIKEYINNYINQI